MKPLAIDLFCGLGGWTEGLLAEGYQVRGYDIEAHEYDGERYPAELVLADVLALDGAQFADAALIVASPPCQEYSYMAMPWSRAKEKAAAIRADETGAELERLNALFNASFRIQREASAAAGRHIPLVVENVRGAIPWVGRSRWNFGSFHLWGDVPALMPSVARLALKPSIAHRPNGATNFHRNLHNGVKPLGLKNEGGSWFGVDGRGNGTTPANPARGEAIGEGQKTAGHVHRRNGARHTKHLTNPAEHFEGVEQSGLVGTRANGKGSEWFAGGMAKAGSKSTARKAASARIAKIPLTLSRWIAATYRPNVNGPAGREAAGPCPDRELKPKPSEAVLHEGALDAQVPQSQCALADADRGQPVTRCIDG